MGNTLPVGNYNSTVQNQSSLTGNGNMVISGNDSNPAVRYNNSFATNVSWTSSTSTLTFTFSGFTFSGSFANESFAGDANNGVSPTGEEDDWTATKTGTDDKPEARHVKKPSNKKPAKKPANKKPAKKPANKKPAKKPANKKPAKKPVSKKPAKKTATKRR